MERIDRCKIRARLRELGVLSKSDEKPNACASCPGNNLKKCYVIDYSRSHEEESKQSDWGEDEQPIAY